MEIHLQVVKSIRKYIFGTKKPEGKVFKNNTTLQNSDKVIYFQEKFTVSRLIVDKVF